MKITDNRTPAQKAEFSRSMQAGALRELAIMRGGTGHLRSTLSASDRMKRKAKRQQAERGIVNMIKLTNEQAKAIEEAKTNGASLFLEMHAEDNNRWVDRYKSLNGLSVGTLAEAIYGGYKVECPFDKANERLEKQRNHAREKRHYYGRIGNEGMAEWFDGQITALNTAQRIVDQLRKEIADNAE